YKVSCRWPRSPAWGSDRSVLITVSRSTRSCRAANRSCGCCRNRPVCDSDSDIVFRSLPSYVGHGVEELVVRVVAPFALINVLEIRHEFDRLDPLDHFEAELVLHPKSQGRAVDVGERLEVHLVSQQGLWVAGVVDRVAVVVLAAFQTLAE